MKKLRLLEEDQQRRALAEFNNLQGIGELVEWDLFRSVLEEVFGPPNTSGCGPSFLGCQYLN